MELQEPKLPEFYSPGRVFLSAFAAGAAINARKAELQQQLMQMDLHNRQMALKEKWDQANYGLDLQKLDEMRRYHTAEIGVRKQEQDRLGEKLTKVSDAIPVLSDFQRELSDIDAPPGTQAWVDKANLIKAKPEYNSIAGTTAAQRVWQQAYTEHKDSAKAIRQNQNDLMANYYTNLNNKKWSDYMFENPQAWDTNSEGDKVLKVKGGVIVSPKAKQNEYDNAITLKPGEWQNAIDTHRQIKDIIQDRAKHAASPDAVISPVPAVSQKLKRAQEALNDPEATPEEKARAQQILSAQ